MKLLSVLKQYLLAISVVYTLTLIVLSLININKISDIGIAYHDKLYHVIAYFLLVVLWDATLNTNGLLSKLLYIAGASIIFGIIIEALQGTLTSYRANDVLDIGANVLGSVIATLFMAFRHRK